MVVFCDVVEKREVRLEGSAVLKDAKLLARFDDLDLHFMYARDGSVAHEGRQIILLDHMLHDDASVRELIFALALDPGIWGPEKPFLWTHQAVTHAEFEAEEFVRDVFRTRAMLRSTELYEKLPLRFVDLPHSEGEREASVREKILTYDQALIHVKARIAQCSTKTASVGLRYVWDDGTPVCYPVGMKQIAESYRSDAVRELFAHANVNAEFIGFHATLASLAPLGGRFYALRPARTRVLPSPEVHDFYHPQSLEKYLSVMLSDAAGAGAAAARAHPAARAPPSLTVRKVHAAFGSRCANEACASQGEDIYAHVDVSADRVPFVKHEQRRQLIQLKVHRGVVKDMGSFTRLLEASFNRETVVLARAVENATQFGRTAAGTARHSSTVTFPLLIKQIDSAAMVVLGDAGTGRAVLVNGDPDATYEDLCATFQQAMRQFCRDSYLPVNPYVSRFGMDGTFQMQVAKIRSTQALVAAIKLHDLPFWVHSVVEDRLTVKFLRVRGCAGVGPAAFQALIPGGRQEKERDEKLRQRVDEFKLTEPQKWMSIVQSAMHVILRPSVSTSSYEVDIFNCESVTDVRMLVRWLSILDGLTGKEGAAARGSKDFRLSKDEEAGTDKVAAKDEGGTRMTVPPSEEDEGERTAFEGDSDFLTDYFSGIELIDAQASMTIQDEETGGDLQLAVGRSSREEALPTKAKATSLIKHLERVDPALFDYRVPKASSRSIGKYSVACQSTRQPVVASRKEVVLYDASRGRGYGEYGEAAPYGSTPALADQNFYMCPEVWCPVSRVPMSSQQFEDAGRRCPFPGIDEVPYDFTDTSVYKMKRTHIGFLPSDKHPDGLTMPCCHARPSVVKEDKSNDKYIKSSATVLPPGRYGLLPDHLDQLFGNQPGRRGSRDNGTGTITAKTYCFVRRGASVDERQPYLRAAMDLLGFASSSVAEFVRLFREHLTPEDFVGIADGRLLKAFVRPAPPLADRREVERFSEHLTRNPNYARMHSLDVAEMLAALEARGPGIIYMTTQADVELQIFRALERFLDYVEAENVFKGPDVMEGLLNCSLPWLNPLGGTIVCLDYADSGSGPQARAQLAGTALANRRFGLMHGQLKTSFVLSSSNGRTRIFDHVCLLRGSASAQSGAASTHLVSTDRFHWAQVRHVLPVLVPPRRLRVQEGGGVARTDHHTGGHHNCQEAFAILLSIGEKVTHFVISLDFAVVGFYCAPSKLIVPLSHPEACCDISLPPGVTFLHEVALLDALTKVDQGRPKQWSVSRGRAKEVASALGYVVASEDENVLNLRRSDGLDLNPAFAPKVMPLRTYPGLLQRGLVDRAIFLGAGSKTAKPPGAEQVDDVSHLLADPDARRSLKALKGSFETLSLVSLLQHRLCPMPPRSKRKVLGAFLEKFWSEKGGGGGEAAKKVERIATKILRDGLRWIDTPLSYLSHHSSPSSSSSSSSIVTFDRRSASDVAHIFESLSAPFVSPTKRVARVVMERDAGTLASPSCDNKQLKAVDEDVEEDEEDLAAAAPTLVTSQMQGMFVQPMTRWRKLLKSFEVNVPSEFDPDFPYKLYQRVCRVVGSMTRLNWTDLKKVACAFISSDREMLELALSTNESLLRSSKGSLEMAARIVASGLYTAGFAEICVLSHIANVRTIVLRRQSQDDDGFMCMNNNNHAAYYVLLQHRYNRDTHTDVFEVLTKDRRNVVLMEGAFSRQMLAFVKERCDCVTCWDDRCVLVVEQAVKKKRRGDVGMLPLPAAF